VRAAPVPAEAKGETTPRGEPTLPDDVASVVRALNPVEAVLADPRSAEPLTERQGRLAEAWAMTEAELWEIVHEQGLKPFSQSKRGLAGAVAGYPCTQQGTASARVDLRRPNVVAAYIVASRRRVLEAQPEAIGAALDLVGGAQSERVRLDAVRHVTDLGGLFRQSGNGGGDGQGVNISIKLGTSSQSEGGQPPAVDVTPEKDKR